MIVPKRARGGASLAGGSRKRSFGTIIRAAIGVFAKLEITNVAGTKRVKGVISELEQSHGDAIASLRLLSKSCVPRMRAYVAAGDDVEAAIQRARDEHMPLMDITDDGDLPTDGEIQGLPVQPGLW